MIEQLERRWLLISPELDFTFGTGGISSLPGSVGGDFFAIRQLPSGKFLAAGGDNGQNALVARFNPDGLLDKTFDGDGVLTVRASSFVADAAFGPDGKIVILSGGDVLNVFRFNADGTADTSFGASGKVAIDTGRTIARAIDVQPDGRIVVGHVESRFNGVGGTYVLRLNVNGTIDRNFRGGAANAVALPRTMFDFDLAVAPDGKIHFVGDESVNAPEQSIAGRLNADGTVDNTFSGDGFAPVTDPALPTVIEDGDEFHPQTRLAEIYIDAQGRPLVLSQLVTGRDNRRRILTRFTTTGARDATFGGGDAWIELQAEGVLGRPLAVAADGKIVVGFESSIGSGRMSIRRHLPDGTPDTAFGAGGIVEFPRDTVRPQTMAFDNAGNLLVAGITNDPNFLSVARLIPVSTNVFLNAEGTLAVDGTDGNDTVTLTRVGGLVVLRRNGRDTSFDAAAVKKLTFFGYMGDDLVNVNIPLDADLFGFDGNDTFVLSDGNVRVDGGAGRNEVVAEDGAHVITLGDDGNFVSVGAGVAKITTGAGNDTIETGDGDDSIRSGDGDDSIVTGGGNDTIYTGNGNDEVAAGAGNDVVQGFASQVPFDSLPGTPPSLVPPVDGANGRKVYFGEDGDDFLIGGSLASTIVAGNGNDTVHANAQDDSILAGAGADDVSAGFGNDTVNGGTGDDILHGNERFGSENADDGSDLLVGGDGNDSLFGQGGDDTLDGGAGDDQLDGGTGNNVLDGSLPGVTLSGGLLAFAGTGADEQVSIWDDGFGHVVVWLNGASQVFDREDVRFVELTGGGGNDLLKLNRFLSISSILNGGSGSDSLYGGSAGDVMRGGDGDDYLFGFAGDDFLDGGLGADELRGGDGRDSLDYSSRVARLIIGLDSLQDDGEGNERDLASPDIERVFGGIGNDIIGGGPGLSLLYGGAGDDTLFGGAGADGLYGAAGNDFLDGESGDDYLEGGAGNDTLYGRDGADQLFGLAGNDRLFSAADNTRDTVRGGAGIDVAEYDDLDDVLTVEN